MWNIESNLVSYNLVDLNPNDSNDIQEVITHVEFHPRRQDTFIFSSSKGYMSLCDMRQSSDFTTASIKFKQKSDPNQRHFFTDIINSMTRAKFSPTSDNYLFSRDYLTLQIWDVRNNKQSVQSFNATDYLDSSLCDLYENQRIFDRFDLQISPDSTMALTGAYFSHAHVIDM